MALDPDLAMLIAQAQGGGGAGLPGIPSRPLRVQISKRQRSRFVDGDAASANVAAGVMAAEGYAQTPTTVATSGVETFSTIDEAVNAWFLMDDDYREQVMEDMFSFGLIDGVNREDQAAGVWKSAVDFAWGYAQAGKDVAPTDMFARMTNLKAGQQGNAPRTTVSRSFNYLDAANAQALVRAAFRQAVGRDATDAEIRTMAGEIISASKQNPSVTTTTVDPEGNSTSRTEGGFDPQAMIANRLDSDPEAKAFQAADELFPALMAALDSPV